MVPTGLAPGDPAVPLADLPAAAMLPFAGAAMVDVGGGCSGVLVRPVADPDPDAPAHVLTNGHCIDMLPPTEVRRDVPTSGTVDRPSTFTWLDPQPNPFNPSTLLRFQLDRTSRLRIQLYDSRGALVRNLAEGLFSSGYNEVRLDAAQQGSGLYLVTMTDLESGRSSSQKLMLLK